MLPRVTVTTLTQGFLSNNITDRKTKRQLQRFAKVLLVVLIQLLKSSHMDAIIVSLSEALFQASRIQLVNAPFVSLPTDETDPQGYPVHTMPLGSMSQRSSL